VGLPVPSGFTHGAAYRANRHNVVVGKSATTAVAQATKWEPDGTPVLLPYAHPRYTQGAARAINDLGWIVGVEYEDPTECCHLVAGNTTAGDPPGWWVGMGFCGGSACSAGSPSGSVTTAAPGRLLP